MTAGKRIFAKNARQMLRDIAMQHLDPGHGAAVEAVRWCLVVRGRPTHYRQAFLELECPALLTYLEALANSGDSVAWRTLEERVKIHAEILKEGDLHPCARPWLAAIWHVLPELAAIGQGVLDHQSKKDRSFPDVELGIASTGDGSEGDKGSSGTAGSAGSIAKPRPQPQRPSRLALPTVTVTLTEAEKKALDLAEDAETADAAPASVSKGPEGTDGPEGPKGSGGKP
jgi:hypothetical protein